MFGPAHWNWKRAAIALVLMAAVGLWWTVTYRTTADAVVDGREQRAVGEPFMTNAPQFYDTWRERAASNISHHDQLHTKTARIGA
jgi:hypothetical protein